MKEDNKRETLVDILESCSVYSEILHQFTGQPFNL